MTYVYVVFPIAEKDIHIKLITVSGSSYIHLTCKVFNHVQIHAHVGVRSVNKAHKLHQNVWRTYHCKRLQSANHLTQGPVNARNLLNAHYIKLHQRVTCSVLFETYTFFCCFNPCLFTSFSIHSIPNLAGKCQGGLGQVCFGWIWALLLFQLTSFLLLVLLPLLFVSLVRVEAMKNHGRK